MEKKHYIGLFILLLILPTIYLLRQIVPRETVIILALLEALIGVSVLLLKKEKMERKLFRRLIYILIILCIFILAVFISFPIWVRLFFT